MMTTLSTDDLDHILKRTLPLWDDLRDQRIFITGGTGFFGAWLLESFIWANEKLDLNAHAMVLTRDISRFSKKCSHLATHKSVSFLEGDIRDFKFPPGQFSHIIHAATDTNIQPNETNPQIMDSIINGTRHIFEFARLCGAKRILLTSSGAVYGKQPAEMPLIHEDYSAAVDTDYIQPSYAEGKRQAEQIAHLSAKQYGLEVKIARCFAFVGPYLPLDQHYAIGNFIRDGLSGGPIIVKGDGTPYRSYLYSADLAIWLWTILFRGQSMRPYNVGSNEAVTISDIAYLVASMFSPPVQVKISSSPKINTLPERYVPDTRRAYDELNLTSWIDVASAIRATTQWHLSKLGHVE